MSQTSRDRDNSRRVRTYEKNSGETVWRLGTIIQSIFCAQSGTSIRLNFWKQLSESRYAGALSLVLEHFRPALSPDPTDCPWVSKDASFQARKVKQPCTLFYSGGTIIKLYSTQNTEQFILTICMPLFTAPWLMAANLSCQEIDIYAQIIRWHHRMALKCSKFKRLSSPHPHGLGGGDIWHFRLIIIKYERIFPLCFGY